LSLELKILQSGVHQPPTYRSCQYESDIYNGLQKTLAFYGATFQNVVKENLYTTNIEEIKKHNAVRKKYYNNDFPAATWVQIQRLYMETALVEVELVAVLP